jgi:general secretion pathway protein H
VAKARTPKSVPGSERRLPAGGFTLIELLLVVALIAVVSALATLAMRDPAATRLDHEAARLSALLESARSEARALGLAVSWQPLPRDGAAVDAGDFRFDGLPPSDAMPTRWLAPGVIAEVVGAPALLLGPEPMIGPQRVILHLEDQRTALATDGLGPFVVVDEAQVQ